MNKIIILLVAITIGLAAQADYTVTTQQPLYPASVVDYSTMQNYNQPYGQYPQTYSQPYNQGYYQNPYQSACQGQYVNPYQYRNSYGNNLPYSVVNSSLNGLTRGVGTTSAVKSIGQSMLFSLLRGY